MENFEKLLENCNEAKIFLVEERGKQVNVLLFPNDDTDVLEQYKSNYEFYATGKEIIPYDEVTNQKHTIQKIELTELSSWNVIKEQIDNLPLTNAPKLTPDRITNKLKMVVVECVIDDEKVYLISKFSFNATYNRKLFFSLWDNGFKKITEKVISFGNNIDALIKGGDVYIFMKTTSTQFLSSTKK